MRRRVSTQKGGRDGSNVYKTQREGLSDVEESL
jgi:hypothetical protein